MDIESNECLITINDHSKTKQNIELISNHKFVTGSSDKKLMNVLEHESEVLGKVGSLIRCFFFGIFKKYMIRYDLVRVFRKFERITVNIFDLKYNFKRSL